MNYLENQNPYSNMMLGIAIGDAFGAGYEFLHKNRLDYAHIQVREYRQNSNPRFKHLVGNYTDDTQMSIGVAEVLKDTARFNYETLAEAFVRCFKRDQVVGYARGFEFFLNSISNGEEFLEKINPKSDRNGAAMRSVPIGVLRTPSEVAMMARVNASITHCTKKGIASSMVVALMSHYQLYHQKMPDIKTHIAPYLRKEFPEFLEYLLKVDEVRVFHPQLILGEEWSKKGVACDGMYTVGAVWWLLKSHKHPETLLQEAVRLGGDTDSVASIAMGIKMINEDMRYLPRFLYSKLANGKYGRDYLISLGEMLNKKYKPHTV